MIAESALQAFRASLRGQLVVPKDVDYDDVRRIHNAMIDRHPGAIVRCAGVADVVAAVNFARQGNLLVAVRGAGHNIAGDVALRWRHRDRSLEDEERACRSSAGHRARRSGRDLGRSQP